MSDRFGEAAARLCSASIALLGWRPDEFWNATPAELGLALQMPVAGGGPNMEIIEDLKRRFPD
jgi:hypothetical protein